MTPGEKTTADMTRREFIKAGAAAGAFALVAGAAPAAVWAAPGAKPDLGGLPELIHPYDVAVAADGTIYVANAGRYGIVRLAGGESRYLGRGPGQGPAQFNFPMGVDVGADGAVYVADTNNGRVQVFTAAGDFARAFGRPGYLDGEFLRPKSVCAYRDGVLVADTRNHRVQYVDLRGERIASGEPVTRAILGGLGEGPGDLKLPRYVAANGDGVIFTADAGHGVVKAFTLEGRLVRTVGQGDIQEPGGVAVAGDGRIFVADVTAGAVLTFNPNGKYLGRVNGLAGLARPRGIALYEDYLLVADADGGRVFVARI